MKISCQGKHALRANEKCLCMHYGKRMSIGKKRDGAMYGNKIFRVKHYITLTRLSFHSIVNLAENWDGQEVRGTHRNRAAY